MQNKLMMGLWRFIINVPPFLWKKQIEKGKRAFERACGRLSEEQRAVHHFAVKELPRAQQPLSPDVISEKTGIPVDRVTAALDRLDRGMKILYRNAKGEVTWAYPVTVDETPHRLTFSTGEKLYAA